MPAMIAIALFFCLQIAYIPFPSQVELDCILYFPVRLKCTNLGGVIAIICENQVDDVVDFVMYIMLIKINTQIHQINLFYFILHCVMCKKYSCTGTSAFQLKLYETKQLVIV